MGESGAKPGSIYVTDQMNASRKVRKMGSKKLSLGLCLLGVPHPPPPISVRSDSELRAYAFLFSA